jgi:5-methylcytosine-specific restriction protein A
MSEGGSDHPDNVMALCPDDHRKAHYSAERAGMRQKMLDMVEEWKDYRRRAALG